MAEAFEFVCVRRYRNQGPFIAKSNQVEIDLACAEKRMTIRLSAEDLAVMLESAVRQDIVPPIVRYPGACTCARCRGVSEIDAE